jgi:OOP family OmpA-OmpF porin
MLFKLMFVLLGLHASAQEKPQRLKYTPPASPKWAMIGIRAQAQDFKLPSLYTDTCNCGESSSPKNMGLGLSVYGNLTDNLSITGDVLLSKGTISRKELGQYDNKELMFSVIRADLNYQFFDSKAQARPYGYVGVNWAQRRGGNFISVPVGLGVRYMFKNNKGMATLQAGYGIGTTEQLRNSVMYSAGIYIKMKGKKGAVADKAKDLDSDLDGVVDDKDKCPTVPGEISNYGCPINDRDRDGIVDSVDNCPDIPGIVKNNGCPLNDSDGDGVLDNFDKCPTVAGPVSNEGCPLQDKDKDGIQDNIDNCPDKPGPISNGGCPLEDRDKDGIMDNLDLCPDIPGLSTNYGCPISELVAAIRNPDGALFNAARPLLKNSRIDGLKTSNEDTVAYIIYFEFDRFDLVQNSYDILNDAIQYLRAHPEYDVSLVGHTDLEGNVPYNLRLSENRVVTSKNYLLSYNIDPRRISTSYFGKSKPYLVTRDESLAWMNRRVEIYLVRRK